MRDNNLQPAASPPEPENNVVLEEEQPAPVEEEVTAPSPSAEEIVTEEVAGNNLIMEEDPMPVIEEPSMEITPPAASPPEPSPPDTKKSWLNKNSLKSWKFKAIVVGGILFIVGFWFFRLIRNRKSRGEFDFSQTNINIDNIEE